jgi:predicted ArsR family transcriptional regulator
LTSSLSAAQARALGGPARQKIVAFLSDAPGPASVSEITAHLGTNHNAVRKHLTQLVAAGLVSEARVRGGGPGRPRLVYELRVDAPAGVDQPYRRLAVLLATALATGETPDEVGRRAGAASMPASSGRGGDGVDALAARFTVDGFDPVVQRDGDKAALVLQRCPFADAAAANPSAVCQLHRGLAEGMASAVGDVTVDDLVAKEPYRAGCVVAVRAAGSAPAVSSS